MKQKKQFRELSDEELESVTGGLGIERRNCLPKSSFEGCLCPSQYREHGNDCCKLQRKKTKDD